MGRYGVVWEVREIFPFYNVPVNEDAQYYSNINCLDRSGSYGDGKRSGNFYHSSFRPHTKNMSNELESIPKTRNL